MLKNMEFMEQQLKKLLKILLKIEICERKDKNWYVKCQRGSYRETDALLTIISASIIFSDLLEISNIKQ